MGKVGTLEGSMETSHYGQLMGTGRGWEDAQHGTAELLECACLGEQRGSGGSEATTHDSRACREGVPDADNTTDTGWRNITIFLSA